MTEPPFNELTPAQAELLALLLEELGEAQQAIGKILRHGYRSVHPAEPDGPDNTERLERELGDIAAAIHLLCERGDLMDTMIETFKDAKVEKVGRYLHHA